MSWCAGDRRAVAMFSENSPTSPKASVDFKRGLFLCEIHLTFQGLLFVTFRVAICFTLLWLSLSLSPSRFGNSSVMRVADGFALCLLLCSSVYFLRVCLYSPLVHKGRWSGHSVCLLVVYTVGRYPSHSPLLVSAAAQMWFSVCCFQVC